MSKLFEPINLEKDAEAAVVKTQPDPTNTIDIDLERQFKQIADEIMRYQAGQSQVRKGAIQLKATDPVMAAWSRLQKIRTRKNINTFLYLVKQDLGLAHAKFFCDILNENFAAKEKFSI